MLWLLLLLATALFTFVPGLIYERLVLSELKRGGAAVQLDARGFAAGFRARLYLRFLAASLLSAAFLSALLWFLLSPGLESDRGEIISALSLAFPIVGFLYSARAGRSSE